MKVEVSLEELSPKFDPPEKSLLENVHLKNSLT